MNGSGNGNKNTNINVLEEIYNASKPVEEQTVTEESLFIEKMNEPKTRLQEADVLRIQLLQEKMNNLKTKVKNVEAVYEKEKLSFEIQRIKMDAKLKEITQSKQTAISNITALQREYQQYIQNLTERMQLTSNKWGFDPETGEIILEGGKFNG